jgi:hypothetical protein
MTHEAETRRVQMASNGQHVTGQRVERVAGRGVGLCRSAVAALVGNCDTPARLDQGPDVLAPGAPVFGKAVQQHRERRVVFTVGTDDVERHVIRANGEGLVFQATDMVRSARSLGRRSGRRELRGALRGNRLGASPPARPLRRSTPHRGTPPIAALALYTKTRRLSRSSPVSC